jgi:hypothetical protein
MKRQKGFSVIAVVAVLATVVVVGSYFVGYLGYRNTAQSFEMDIPAQYTETQNVYDNGWKKVVEIAQVPEMQAQQVKDVYAGVMTGRYGSNGSHALLQMLTEQNPNLGQDVYVTVQRTVEAFHDSLQASQTNLIARKQEYSKFVTATTAGIFYNWLGHYPHIKIGVPNGTQDDFQIVTSDKTQSDFKAHKSEPLNLLKK